MSEGIEETLSEGEGEQVTEVVVFKVGEAKR